MKSMTAIRLVFAGVCALLVFGCSVDTREGRIKEKSAAFAELTPEEQRIIRNGYIELGYTPDMVYIALGKPERIAPGNGPGDEDWIYHNFYAQDGSSLAPSTKVQHSTSPGGIPSIVNPGPKINTLESKNVQLTYQVVYDPTAEHLKSESTVKVHVKFKDGEVSDIQIVNDGKA